MMDTSPTQGYQTVAEDSAPSEENTRLEVELDHVGSSKQGNVRLQAELNRFRTCLNHHGRELSQYTASILDFPL